MGVAGAVGIAQRLFDIVGDFQSKRSQTEPPDRATMLNQLSEQFRNNLIPELKAAKELSNVIGPAAVQIAITTTLLAIRTRESVELISFDPIGGFERATLDIPFVAIGSGQQIADPFLAFIRRIFWPTQPPTTAEGIFAVTWALRHAIATNAGGVSDPIQMAVLDADGRAREVSEDELHEHLNSIEAAERRLKDFRTVMSEASTSVVPNPR